MINYEDRITPENIDRLYGNEVFVFGSNESGIHGAGAAHLAWERFGAKYGVGFGLTGRSFALPTKSWFIRDTLSLEDIEFYVNRFISFAEYNPDSTFLVTQIGCGLAGYSPTEIAPLFKNATEIENIFLPEVFWQILNNEI